MGAESKPSSPNSTSGDADDHAGPTPSGLARKPAHDLDEDDDDGREERTELQMDAELVAKARHRLLFGRAKPADASAPAASVPVPPKAAVPAAPPPPPPAAAPVAPRPSPLRGGTLVGVTAAPGIPRRLPTPSTVNQAAVPPPGRPQSVAPGPLHTTAAPGIPRRLPTPSTANQPAVRNPSVVPGPLSTTAAPGIPRRLPTPTLDATNAANAARPGPAPRGPTPRPGIPRSKTMIGMPMQPPPPSAAAPPPTAPPVASAPVVASPDLPIPSASEGIDVLGASNLLGSDSAITEENLSAPVEVPVAFEPAETAEPEVVSPVANAIAPMPDAPPAFPAPIAAADEVIARAPRRRRQRSPLDMVAVGVAIAAVFWAIWLLLFYRR